MKAGAGKPDKESDVEETMRLDRLLVYLRFARTRSAACDIIEGRALRLNRKHVQRVSENVSIGDVLTLMIGSEVHVIEIVSLPQRRASPGHAKSHYRELSP
jgi:ribosome-associated heat shock protein Hsp15